MAEQEKPKKNVKTCRSCSEGKHTFIVSNWQIHGGQQKAMHLLCQHCLMPMDLTEMRNAEWFKGES